MIVVNSPGTDDVYPLIEHAPWHGCTLADFVFPSFLVIMGFSLSLSLRRRLERGDRRAAIFKQTCRRAAAVVALGLLMNLVFYGSGSLPVFRYYGVLQRIGVCILLASALFLTTGWRGQAAAAAALLLGYWPLLTRVPVPGFGAPDLSPEGNLAGWLDRLLFMGHLYTPRFDPEGTLSTLPSLATTLLGVLAGRWHGSRRPLARRALGLVGGGLVLAAVGRAWSAVFPLNKHLWTSSFALYTGGLSLAAYGVCFGVVEIRGSQGWGRPFEWFGRNALLSYFLSGLGYGAQEFVSMAGASGRMSLKLWATTLLFSSWLKPQAASLAYALAYTGLCLWLMRHLHRREIFLKV